MNVGITNRTRGNYILLIAVPRRYHIAIGALGVMEFRKGFYAYVGSAMGGLQTRIRRHMVKRKKMWWHIDYLVAKGRVEGVLYALMGERLECRLAQGLERSFRSTPGFGSSDCRCPSHLFFSEDRQALQERAAVLFKGLLKEGELVIEGC